LVDADEYGEEQAKLGQCRNEPRPRHALIIERSRRIDIVHLEQHCPPVRIARFHNSRIEGPDGTRAEEGQDEETEDKNAAEERDELEETPDIVLHQVLSGKHLINILLQEVECL